MSGFFEIGIYMGKNPLNLGTLWRSAYQLGAAGVFTIGKRYSRQASDTMNVPGNIPLRTYPDFEAFLDTRPFSCQLVAVEMGGKPLESFGHPPQAVYILGSEDNGLPQSVLDRCKHVVSISAVRQASYNVAVAGSIVMHHRLVSRRPHQPAGAAP